MNRASPLRIFEKPTVVWEAPAIENRVEKFDRGARRLVAIPTRNELFGLDVVDYVLERRVRDRLGAESWFGDYRPTSFKVAALGDYLIALEAKVTKLLVDTEAERRVLGPVCGSIYGQPTLVHTCEAGRVVYDRGLYVVEVEKRNAFGEASWTQTGGTCGDSEASDYLEALDLYAKELETNYKQGMKDFFEVPK